MSYIIPYTLISGTIGGTITYATDHPIFAIIGILIGIGSGMIRDNNIKNNQNTSGIGSSIVKAIGVYVLGPSLFAGACVLAIYLCAKYNLKY